MTSSVPLRQDLRFTHVASNARIAWARSGRGPALLRAGHWMTHVEYDCESALFRFWTKRLGRGVTLYRYDERGSGLSGTDGAPHSRESAVEEIGAVLDASGLPSAALPGISGGAAVDVEWGHAAGAGRQDGS